MKLDRRQFLLATLASPVAAARQRDTCAGAGPRFCESIRFRGTFKEQTWLGNLG